MLLFLQVFVNLMSVDARIIETSATVSTLTDPILTNKGIVFGQILKTAEQSLPYAAFKGIPYAKPPLKELRFKPPVDVESWGEPLYALSDDSLMCIQLDENKRDVIGMEDCLYLNIYTPHTSFGGKSKPVMVWIHGGAFNTGNSNSSRYGPDSLIEEDVILVTLNYRLGPFGFLNFHHENATGNCGLKDQNLALRWIQKNIGHFGGDPYKVTIFGKDAGSVSVDLHLVSDMSAGLFQKSIAMSGSPLCLWWSFQNATEAEHNVYQLVRKFGVNTRDKSAILKVLQKIPADQIIRATQYLNSQIPFRPTLENPRIAREQEKFLTECPLKKFQRKNYTKGPHMLGFSSSDLVSFVKRNHIDLSQMIDKSLDHLRDARNFDSLMLRVGSIRVKTVNKDVHVQLATDLFFNAGIDSQQRLIAAGNEGHPIFYYRFSPDSQSSEDSIGILLENDFELLFYRSSVKISEEEKSLNSSQTQKKLVRMWANFAKYGSPTPQNVDDDLLKIDWPNSGGLGIGLDIDNGLRIRYSRPTSPLMRFLQEDGYQSYNFRDSCRKGAPAIGIVTEADVNQFKPISRG